MLYKRTDIYVDVELVVMKLLETQRFKNSKIRKVGIMEEVGLHMFLHKKYKSLVAKLSNTLKEMMQDGWITNIVSQ